MITFEWNNTKALANLRKHGITFDEAKMVFYDQYARIINDTENSTSEDRFIMLGLSTKLRLLVVCHCYREDDSVVRIISARKATAKEANVYERFCYEK